MLISQRMVQRSILFAACLVCVAVPLAGQPNAENQQGDAKRVPASPNLRDKDKLQGKWLIMSVAMEETVIKRDDPSNPWKETFQHDVVVEGDRLGQRKAGLGKFKLDDTRDPKQITIQDAEGKLTFRGIYALDGDQLKVCIDGDGTDVRRPEAFVTKKGAPLILMELKRAP